MGLKNNQLVKLKIDGDKSGVLDAWTKVSDDGYFEAHLDTDDANAHFIKQGDIVEIIK